MGEIASLPQRKAPPSPLPVRTYAEIYEDLVKEVPTMFLKKKSKGGSQLTFVPWFYVCRALDRYAPGWEYQISAIQYTEERVMISVSITIHGSDRSVRRDSTGTETFKQFDARSGQMLTPAKEHAYGDPLSNAEGMALRRAAAKHGFARHLYEREKS